MPSYAKEILTNKKKIHDDNTITLIEEYNAIIQNKMTPKLKYPRRFSIPCVTGNHVIDKALCDLGASVSIMHLYL